MAISMKHLTEELGISKTSIYLYMRDPDTKRVGAETKEKIAKAIEEYNYRLNVNAQSLSQQKSRVIAILIPLDAPYFRITMLNELLSGIQNVLFKMDYKFIFIPTRGIGSPIIIKQQLERSHGYDGFILFGTRSCSIKDMKENVKQLLKTEQPFVVLNMPDLGFEINQVINLTPKASSTIRYLIELGHKRILLMGGASKAPDMISSIQEYVSCYEDYSLTVDENLIVDGGYEKTVSKSKMINVLNNNLNFSAVYCLSDTMALGVYEAITEKGLIIPDDISVIGKDDSFFTQFLNPPLTTIRVPMFETGVKGAESLLRSIETKEAPRKIFLENELILRLSTRVYQFSPKERR